MKKRTVYKVGYACDYEGIAEYLTEHKVLPEDVVEIRHEPGSTYRVMYVIEVTDD